MSLRWREAWIIPQARDRLVEVGAIGKCGNELQVLEQRLDVFCVKPRGFLPWRVEEYHLPLAGVCLIGCCTDYL